MAQKITSAKNCRRDARILLFTSAFAECRRELERLFSAIREEHTGQKQQQKYYTN